jgi:hypothetical protein
MNWGKFLRSPHTSSVLLAMILCVALGVPGASRADVIIFDNLNTPSPDAMLDVSFTQWDAQSFTVGPSNIQLSLAELNLAAAQSSGGNFFLRLYNNSGTNLPGSALETLVGNSNPAAAGIYSYTGSTLLSANTKYWIVAGVSTGGGGNYQWRFELPANVEVGQSIGSIVSFTQGQSWLVLNDGPPLLTFNMRVSGVPEPSGFVLTTVGLAIGLGLRKRKTSNQLA